MNKIKNELKRAGQLVKQEVVLIDEQFKNLLIEDLKNFLKSFKRGAKEKRSKTRAKPETTATLPPSRQRGK
jgi:hypothetical protein